MNFEGEYNLAFTTDYSPLTTKLSSYLCRT